MKQIPKWFVNGTSVQLKDGHTSYGNHQTFFIRDAFGKYCSLSKKKDGKLSYDEYNKRYHWEELIPNDRMAILKRN